LIRNAFNILESYGENNDVPEKQVLKIAYSISSALEYMHKKQIAHRDIKLENVLVNAKGEYKLCDFGSSSKEVILFDKRICR
jgi:serine/threonine protein kinase